MEILRNPLLKSRMNADIMISLILFTTLKNFPVNTHDPSFPEKQKVRNTGMHNVVFFQFLHFLSHNTFA